MKKTDDSTLMQSISQVTTSWDKENYYYYIHLMNKHNLFLVTPIPDIISFLIL